MQCIYYLFEQLPFDETKKLGARNFSEHRRDCTRIYDPNKTNPLKDFISRSPGIIRLSIRENHHLINAAKNRVSDVSLWGRGGNLSSLYSDVHNSIFYYGNPKIGTDAYLFKCTENFKEIELFIIEGGRWMLQNHYEAFLSGEYDNHMEKVRKESIRFQDYVTQF